MIDTEGYRIARQQPGPSLYDRPAGTGMVESTSDGWTLPDLYTRIRELTDRVRDHFDRATPAAPATAPQPEPQVPEFRVLSVDELLDLPKEATA